MKIYEMTFGDDGQRDRDFFFSPNKQFIITKFQRPYTWDEYQIRGVIQDIDYIRKTHNTVGWPSMLVQESQSGNLGLQTFDLGDGQQRSTTVFLFLTAIWHKWKLDYRETNKAQEHEFFDHLFYIGNERNKGVLGRKVHGVIETAIEFQTPSATAKIETLFNTNILIDEHIKILKDAVTEQEKSYQIYNSFLIFWEELQQASYSEKELKNIAETLLTKIVFPVVVYTKDEDMFRAFANINSFGEPLTQSELVKAEIYGRVKAVDPKLANTIAEYWNNTMDTWFVKYKDHKLFNFDWFLMQEFNIFNKWDMANRKEAADFKKKTIYRNRWLKTKWQEHFQRKAVELNNDPDDLKSFYEETWDRMKTHFKIVQIIAEKASVAPLSREWELQYTYDIFSALPMGIIFQLYDEMKEKDFKKTMALLRRYYMFNVITYKDPNSQQLLTHNDSPLRSGEALTYEIFEEFLLKKESRSGKWLSGDELYKIVSFNEYDSKNFNTVLSKLFIYINNEKLVENGHQSSQTSTVGISGISREHIISQSHTDRSLMDIIEQGDYDRKISKLGNLLIITGGENSAIKNAPVKDKISIYQNSKNTSWGNFWIDDFLKDYNKNPERWENIDDAYEAIDERSKKLAKIIANYISVPNNGKVEIGDSNFPIKSITIEDSKGNKSSGKSITGVFVEYLKQIIEDPNVRRTLIENSGIRSCFYYSSTKDTEIKSITLIDKNIFLKNRYLSRDEMVNIIDELKATLFGYNTTLTVEYGDSNFDSLITPTQTNSNYQLTDSLGHKIEAKNLRKLYKDWIKLLVKNDGYKSVFYLMLSEGSAIFKSEEIVDKNNNRWTEKLDEGLYLMANLSAKDIYRRIDKLAERLNIKVKAG